MICKSIKTIVLTGLGVAVVGGLLFGRDALSYFRSAVGSVRDVAKDNVPIEFELRRARDLLNDIIPEMQANIRVIAQQEVEIANLKTEIAQSNKALGDEQARVQKLRETLNTQNTSYREKTRSQKSLLENQIESLEGQFRLVQAAAVGSKLHIDHSKLAQTQKVLADIKKQLDVAERVLAHESHFTEEIKVDVVDEKELTASVDEHFGSVKATESTQSSRISEPAVASHN